MGAGWYLSAVPAAKRTSFLFGIAWLGCVAFATQRCPCHLRSRARAKLTIQVRTTMTALLWRLARPALRPGFRIFASVALLGGVFGQAVNPLTALAAGSAYQTAVLSDAPSAYWRLGEVAGSTT